MNPSIKKGLMAGIIGAAIGAYGWAVLLGLVIKDVLLIILPILFGLICVFGFIRLRGTFPQKKWLLTGSTVVWIIITNLALFNAYYPRITDQLYHGKNELLRTLLSTNKAQVNPLVINLLFGIILVCGVGLILMDVIRSKRR
ncbi:MAG: hypothetical protein GF421_00240 [Candidatus Aminicenantes bacterium]|nr:hypothetical protein [Candidatus Aminicenantes bacterium]